MRLSKDITNEELINTYLLIRQATWRYQLDQMELEVARRINAITRASFAEIKAVLKSDIDPVLRSQYQSIERELASIIDATQQAISGVTAEASALASVESLAEQDDILTFAGTSKTIMGSALTGNQLVSLVRDTPLGGHDLQGWISRTFENAGQNMLDELQKGVLQGESYVKLISRLNQVQEGLGRDSITIARTYVQTANNTAIQAVFEENNDVIKGWTWQATFEPGYKNSGRGTCLRCAALDGQTFKLGEGPPIPLHPNCRCFQKPAVKSWRELGIDLDDVESSVRAFSIREDENVDGGLMRTILEAGTTNAKNYADWFSSQSPVFQRDALGPKRYGLYHTGTRFEDFVDKTGKLILLDELS